MNIKVIKYIIWLIITSTMYSYSYAQSCNRFIQNKGQWNKEVKFLFKTNNYHAWITEFGIVYDYFETSASDNSNDSNKIFRSGNVIKLKFANINDNIKFIGKNKFNTKHNYFIGSDTAKWAKNVELFNEVHIQNIYQGINIRYYADQANGGNLRYDFEIQPFANPSLIQFDIDGSDSISVNNNNELEICVSDKRYKHTNLVAFQQGHVLGHVDTVAATFSENKKARGHVLVGFEVGQYDISRTLIIDPLIYSLIVGGEAEERAYAVAIDSSGAVYWTGYTYSLQYPTVSGSYHINKIDGKTKTDVFISKVDPTGKIPYFSTYLGGYGVETGRYIKIDELNCAYIVGETNSNDVVNNFETTFPIVAPVGTTSELTTYKNGYNTFLSKISPSGDELLLSVLIGGNNNDNAGGLSFITKHDIINDIDTVKSIVVATQLSGYPVTLISPYISPDAAQASFGGGQTDCYISILNKAGSQIEYATYWGGNGNEIPKSITTDKAGNVYIASNTASTNVSTSSNAAYKNSIGGGDIIVAKFNESLTEAIYSTYIGGSRIDSVQSMAVDTFGSVYITGFTTSDDFPIDNILSQNLKPDTANIFITKLSPAGDALSYSTSITTSSHNYATGIVVDAENNAHISGYTLSTDYPVTWDAFFAEYSEHGDALYTVINSTGDSIIFSSYIGGNQYEYAYGLALDHIGAAYICGTTLSGESFPHSHIIADSIPDGSGGTTVALDSYDCFIFKAMYRPYPGELITNIDAFGAFYCPGSALTIRIYTPYGFYYSDNVFSIQLSDINGIFTPNSMIIGSLTASTGDLLTITFPTNLPASKKYRIRAISSHPRSIGAPNNIDLDISPPYIELDTTVTSVCSENDIFQTSIHSNRCFNADNVYTLELSDEAGTFNNPVVLATHSGNGSVTFDVDVPASIKPNIVYKLRCVSSSPRVVSNIVDFNVVNASVQVDLSVMNSLQDKCAGEMFDFPFFATDCFGIDNEFYLMLSDANGNFSGAVVIASCQTSLGTSDYNMSVTIPADLPYSERYKLKLISSSPQYEYVFSDNGLDVSYSLGGLHIFTDNLQGLTLCYDTPTDVEILTNNCFQPGTTFGFYIETQNGWYLAGECTDILGDNRIEVLIPLSLQNMIVARPGANGDSILAFIGALAAGAEVPYITSDTVFITLASKELKITGHTPTELCSGMLFGLLCTANSCIMDSVSVFVELSIGDDVFLNPIRIGSGKVLGNNSVIQCNLPDDIDYSSKYYVRLIDDKGYYSENFLLGINPPGLAFNVERSKLEVLCTGVTFYIDFTAFGCFEIDNIFSIVLSDVYGEFGADAQVIGSVTSANSGRIQVHIPFDILEGANYKLKIISSNPSLESILDFDITVQIPYILIDSFNNLTQCDPNPILLHFPTFQADEGGPYIKFTTSGCFGEDNIFILQFGKTSTLGYGDFTAPINVDSCAWNEREFNFTLPPNMGEDNYRFRIIATNPNVWSVENGFDITYNQPYATLLGINNPIICRNQNFVFNYTTSECFNIDNVFYLEMSDEYGSFANSLILDSSSSLLSGKFNVLVPETIPYNKLYKLRIRSTSPVASFVQNQIAFSVRGPEILTGNLYRVHTKRNDTLYVPFNCNCMDMEGKTFAAQLSDPYGNFDTKLELGTKVGWEPNGKIYSRISLYATDGSGYRIRVICKDPYIEGTTNGKDITIFGFIASTVDTVDTNLKVHPSPFDDKLIVILPGEQLIKSISIIDLLGRQRIKLDNINDNLLSVTTESLEIGTYILFIETNKKTYQKLILKSSSTKK